MAYDNNVPQATQTVASTQPLIQGNFAAIDTVFAKNHVAFNDGNEGKHKFMQMPEQSSAPSTAANEGALYTKESGSITELFFRRESNGSEIQLTGQASGTTNGSVSIGGIIIKWGSVSVAEGANGTLVTFTTPFPASAFSAVTSILSTDGAAASTSIIKTFSTTSVRIVHNRSGSRTCYWVAIGS